MASRKASYICFNCLIQMNYFVKWQSLGNSKSACSQMDKVLSKLIWQHYRPEKVAIYHLKTTSKPKKPHGDNLYRQDANGIWSNLAKLCEVIIFAQKGGHLWLNIGQRLAWHLVQPNSHANIFTTLLYELGEL